MKTRKSHKPKSEVVNCYGGDGVCDAFLCLCHPHIRPMGVKCQHEIIRCLKAFMNNKVSCLAVFFFLNSKFIPIVIIFVMSQFFH